MTTNKARALPNVRQDDITAAQFDATFLEHWQPVYRALLRLVGDHAEAEDLALETFWRLYQRPPSKQREREANLGGWLYRVATNLGLNALRARKRRQQHEMQAGKWTIETSTLDPAQAAADEDARRCVREILTQMGARQAQLLILRHSGFGYADLAAALDIAPGSIGTLLARAEREFEKRYRRATSGE